MLEHCRGAELMDPGERELGLRLGARDVQHAEPRGTTIAVAEQRRLPDAGFAADDEDGALALAHAGQVPVERLALARTVEEPGRDAGGSGWAHGESTVTREPVTGYAAGPETDLRPALPRHPCALASIAPVTTSVLVVDDDPAFRALAVRMLAGMGLTVVGNAGTVEAATRAALDLRPESALVDVGLTDGDGLALARTLAALPWRPRVVLTSSDPDATSPAAARSAGAAAFITKDDLPGSPLAELLAGEYG